MTGSDPEGLPERGGYRRSTGWTLRGLPAGLGDHRRHPCSRSLSAGAGVATERWPVAHTWLALVVVLAVHITLLVVMYA